MAGTSPNRQPLLLRLTFLSQASWPLDAQELEAIRQSARRRNARLGITGMLMHRDGRFYAALEGPERALLKRMEVIVSDPRHRDLRILNEHRIEARRFENWSFAALPASSPVIGGPGWAEDAFITMLASRFPRDSG